MSPTTPFTMKAGLAFWLVPTAIESTILKREMGSLRMRVGSSYSAPFSPHATLLGGLQEDETWNRDSYWKKVGDLVQEWRKQNTKSEGEGLKVQLQKVETRGIYFQVSSVLFFVA